MRIDLRYLIVFALFYAPGVMMLIGAWMLGYSTMQVREVVVTVGAVLGAVASLTSGISLFEDGHPIWFRIGGKSHD